MNEIGAELGVGAILDSSVERVANRVKIVTILYDARTNRRLWGASYDREMKDVFAIQSDVAEQIAAALQELGFALRVDTEDGGIFTRGLDEPFVEDDIVQIVDDTARSSVRREPTAVLPDRSGTA